MGAGGGPVTANPAKGGGPAATTHASANATAMMTMRKAFFMLRAARLHSPYHSGAELPLLRPR